MPRAGAGSQRVRWEPGLVIVDKSAGMTSHDVVARVRRLAGTRRVGHAGTLDPMATGVLVVGVEKATRLLGHLMLTEKTYAATIRLGQSTTTDDAEGEPGTAIPVVLAADSGVSAGRVSPVAPAVAPPGAREVSMAALDAGIARLTGEIMQVPPGVSAIKIGGERAYRLTRAGQAPELKPRPVTVYEFTVTGIRQAGDCLDVDATIRCSSGTYIRALARDLGTDLGTGGHLTALRRTAVGPYGLDRARTLEDLENQVHPSERGGPASGPAPAVAASSPVTPLAEAAAAAFPRLDLTADEARRLAQGARLPLPAAPSLPAPGVPVAAFGPDGTLVALVTAEAGQLRSLAVFS